MTGKCLVWTEERVKKAYTEWQELSDHATQVIAAMQRAQGWDEGYYGDLLLPRWRGTDFPGKKLIVEDEDDDHDGRTDFPIEWLWTYPACVEKAQAEHDAWKQTREAAASERAERQQYERLKAKFEAPKQEAEE